MTISMKKYEKALGWVFLFMTPLVLPMLIVSLCDLLPVQPDSAQLNAIVFAVDFLLTVLIFHRFLWKNGLQALSRPGKTFLWMGIGFAVYQAGNSLIYILMHLLAPDFSNANDQSIQALLQEHYWLLAPCIVILVPITEETLYRGLVFGSIRKHCRWLAYVVSASAFSALHVISYIGTLSPLHLVLSFLQYLPGGIALALAYDMSESLWSSILIHSTINLIALIAMR